MSLIRHRVFRPESMPPPPPHLNLIPQHITCHPCLVVAGIDNEHGPSTTSLISPLQISHVKMSTNYCSLPKLPPYPTGPCPARSQLLTRWAPLGRFGAIFCAVKSKLFQSGAIEAVHAPHAATRTLPCGIN